MTASNPLDIEPAGKSATPALPMPEPVAVAAGSVPVPIPIPVPEPATPPRQPVEAQWADPQWVEMAAGRALQRAAEAPALPARRPIELELVTRREDDEVAAEARARAADEAGDLYRTAYATVMTVVLSFFVSGTGMCVYVLMRR